MKIKNQNCKTTIQPNLTLNTVYHELQNVRPKTHYGKTCVQYVLLLNTGKFLKGWSHISLHVYIQQISHFKRMMEERTSSRDEKFNTNLVIRYIRSLLKI